MALQSCRNIRHSLCISENGWGMHRSKKGLSCTWQKWAVGWWGVWKKGMCRKSGNWWWGWQCGGRFVSDVMWHMCELNRMKSSLFCVLVVLIDFPLLLTTFGGSLCRHSLWPLPSPLHLHLPLHPFPAPHCGLSALCTMHPHLRWSWDGIIWRGVCFRVGPSPASREEHVLWWERVWIPNPTVCKAQKQTTTTNTNSFLALQYFSYVGNIMRRS